MKITKILGAVGAICLFTLFAGQAYTASDAHSSTTATPAVTLTEGKEYKSVVETPASEEPVIVEYFSYACPHCYSMEAYLDKWKKQKPEAITFKRVPVIFRDSWEPYARAYYIAEHIGRLEELHAKLFYFTHEEKKRIKNNRDLKAFFVANGVDPKEFDGLVTSFVVDSQVNQARQLAKQFQITSTPMFIINDKYQTSGSMAGDYSTLFEVLNQVPLKK